MNNKHHLTVKLANKVNKYQLIEQILNKKATGTFEKFNSLKGELFSDVAIQKVIRYEFHEDKLFLNNTNNRELRSFSSGERKKIYLEHCINQQPDFLILDNPFEHLDIASREAFTQTLEEYGKSHIFIQFADKQSDLLPFIENNYKITDNNFILEELTEEDINDNSAHISSLPKAFEKLSYEGEELVKFDKVSVSYNEKPAVKDIKWTIKKNEFWQLVGPNGSGKSTLLSLITGDNHKGYGQELYIFGQKKGTGESVWDIKRRIGYFNPSLTELFERNHTLEQMILSGFYDSIGLYRRPTPIQETIAKQWLQLLDLQHLAKSPFNRLTIGQQRIALIARAFIKHPVLLILDEPLEGLDDENTLLVTQLINKIYKEFDTSILFVSHLVDHRIHPNNILELIPHPEGSVGKTNQ